MRRRAVPFYRRLRFLLPFGAGVLAFIAGIAVLLPSGNLLLPFETVEVLEGKLASKGDYFDDPEVQRILMRHRIRVHVTSIGSRDVAKNDIDSYDFVFPSGTPQSSLILRDRIEAKPPKYATVYRPFISPIVLATYKEYADTLVAKGIATPQKGDLYHTLDLGKFLELVAERASWNRIGIKGLTNGNAVLAHSPNICSSNSSGTYMGLVAFVRNGNKLPQDTEDAKRLAREIKPLVTAQGLPSPDLFRTYQTPEGKGVAPIVVVYEHQFLAYQVDYKARHKRFDYGRVLLYPSTNFVTQPEFIALNERGDRLGQLVTDHPGLRRRALELGFRVLSSTPKAAENLEFTEYLKSVGLPEMSSEEDYTKAVLPALDQFEEMITVTGDCP